MKGLVMMSTSLITKSPSVFNLKKYSAIAVCIVIAIAATFLGKVQKFVGAPMIGLFISITIVNPAACYR
jgi:Ca2+/Na+ antiporter